MKRVIFLLALAVVFLTNCNNEPTPNPNGGNSVNLIVKVVDPYMEPQEGASVYLYNTQSDYLNERNHIGDVQISDLSGMVYFYSLQPTAYYIRIRKGGMSNINGQTTTPTLQFGNNNYTYEIY